jgi:hypothetical protein
MVEGVMLPTVLDDGGGVEEEDIKVESGLFF